MLIPFLISKIHKARITETDLNYSGSISIDPDIMKKASLREFQKVDVYNITNGNRFSTYVISGGSGSKDIVINGAAAHLVSIGDEIIVAAYALIDERELDSTCCVILLMNENNDIESVINGKI